MGFKITLSDGRTFEEWQEVELFYKICAREPETWNRQSLEKSHIPMILSCQDRVRHIAPKVKRKRTAREVDQIINVDRRVWIYCGSFKKNIGGLITECLGVLTIEGLDIELAVYESAKGEWLSLAEVEE